MKKLFKKFNKSAILNGRKFLSALDFFELSTFGKELQNHNPGSNSYENPQIVQSDTFTDGNVINTANWTVTNIVDCVTIAQVNGSGLVFTNTHGCATTFYQNYLQSVNTVATSYKGASVQANLTWTVDSTAKSVACICLWFDSNNAALIRTDSTFSTDIRIQIVKGGVTVYDIIDTGVTKGKDFRITYNYSDYSTKFWYKSLSGRWVQIGNTQNYNISNGLPAYMLISDLDQLAYTGANTVTIKDTYMYSTDELISTNYGDIVNQNFTTLGNLSGYTILQPASTISLTGGYLRLNNAGSGGFANYIQYDTYGSSQLSIFKEEIIFIPQNKTATSYGITLGVISTNTTSIVSIGGFMQLYTGGGAVQLYKNGLTLGSASAALTYNVGDRIKLIFERIENYYSIKAINMATGLQVSTSTVVSSSVTSNTPNTNGKFVIYSNGGIQDVEYLNVSSADNKDSKVCFVGDSITYSYSATALKSSYSRTLTYSGTNTYTINASVGAKTADVLSCINEIIALKPYAVILMIGGNDIAAGVAAATYEANYSSIVSQLKAAGINVIHCYATPRTPTNITALNTFISATFTTDTIIDTYTPLKGAGTTLSATYDSGDGVHPNNAGHTLIASTILTAVPTLL